MIQYHYPAIAPIIKEVCKEHGVQYIHLDTFWEAMAAHLRHLKNMGQEVSYYFALLCFRCMQNYSQRKKTNCEFDSGSAAIQYAVGDPIELYKIHAYEGITIIDLPEGQYLSEV